MECLGIPGTKHQQGANVSVSGTPWNAWHEVMACVGRNHDGAPPSQQSPTTEPHNRMPPKTLVLLHPQQERGIDRDAAENPTPFDDSAYMKPWGRMPVKLLCGDFYSCPTVPATPLLLAPGIEPHPREPAIEDQDSIRTHGCAVLHFMPKSIYVRIPGCDETFLQEGTTGGAQSTDMDLTGMLAIKPQTRSWHFTPAASKTGVTVSRTQEPLLPSKQCTLHGVQGKTADPGFIVHWSYPPGHKEPYSHCSKRKRSPSQRSLARRLGRK